MLANRWHLTPLTLFAGVKSSLDVTTSFGHSSSCAKEGRAVAQPERNREMSHRDCHVRMNWECLGQCLHWLLAGVDWSTIRFRGDCGWRPKTLAAGALLWAWSDELTLGERARPGGPDGRSRTTRSRTLVGRHPMRNEHRSAAPRRNGPLCPGFAATHAGWSGRATERRRPGYSRDTRRQ